MKVAAYCGEQFPYLCGELALIEECSDPRWVSAQFNNRSLHINHDHVIDEQSMCGEVDPGALGFGWHDFPSQDFEIVNPREVSNEE